jgi:O-antigen ligase
MWIRVTTIFVPLCLFSNPQIQKRAASSQLFGVLPWAACAGALALGIELALHGPLLKFVRGPAAQLFQYNRGFSYLVVLAFPIMAGLWISKRRGLLAAFVLILFIPASLTESRAAKLALVLGLLATAAYYVLPVVTRRLMMLLPFVVLGWPVVAQKIFLYHHDWIDRMPHSWQDRMEIWDYMSYRIFERPLLGWGLGSSPALPLAEPHGALYRVTLTPAPHPHNAVLQLWVELGLPGLALGIVFALFALQRIGRLGPAIAPFAAGAWAAGFCLAMIAYNFWADSLWAAFALTWLAVAMLEQKPLPQDS